MRKTFREFVDQQGRMGMYHLRTIKKVLESNGFTVESHLKKEDPYIFVYSNNDDLSFGGVRIYKIGDIIAYRIQKEHDTHPYGSAYLLDIEEIYNDLISDYGDEEKAGEKIIKIIGKEFKTFFKTSYKAEKTLEADEIELNGGKITTSPNYSTSITSQML
jgi:hypothetical protein